MSRLKTASLVLLLFVAFVLLELFIGSWASGPSPARDHTSLNTNQWGTMALLEVCQRLGMAAERCKAPFKAGFLQPGETLLMLDPRVVPEAAEFRALWTAVRQGATVVIAVSAVRDTAPVSPTALKQGEIDSSDSSTELTLAYLGMSLRRAGGATRLAVPEEAREGALVGVAAVEVPSAGRLATPGPSKERLKETVKNVWGEKSGLPHLSDLGRPQVLLEDGGGRVLVRWKLGKGTVYAASEVEMFSNEKLGQADNAVLALNLVAGRGRPRRVVFDEHHHGLSGRAEAAGNLNYAAFAGAMWLALLAIVVYLGGHFWRLGRPEPTALPPRRSALEYVEAIASLYQAAEAGGLAVTLAAGDFRRRLAERLGLPAHVPDDLLLAEAPHAGLSPSRLASLLKRLRAVSEEDRLSDAEVVRFVREISDMEEAFLPHG